MIASLGGLFVTLAYWLVVNFHVDGAYNQDLGRHLKLGELIVKTGKVPFTNLFTYTNTNYPFVNHHWLSEVVYYVIHLMTGDSGLLILKIVSLMSISFLIWLFLGKDTRKIIWYVLGNVLFVPLFLERPDTRPEIFGYVFFAYLLCLVAKKVKQRYLVFLPVIMVLWVNMHITFVFGFFLLFFIALTYGKKSYLIILLSVAVTLFNPRFLYGSVFPFLIFRDYGYSIAENQSIPLLIQLTHSFTLKYVLLLTPLYLLSLFSLLWSKKFSLFTVLFTFLFLTLFQERHLPFFVITLLASFIFVGDLPWQILPLQIREVLSNYKYVLVSSLFVFYCFFLVTYYGHINEQNRFGGFGYSQDFKSSTQFFLRTNLPGPIFNNFDNGGYLDYKLYPNHLTFVDNRPDAFPGKFFREVYIPMQTDASVWKKIESVYKFRSIIFSYTDQTPWARSFSTYILSQPEWKLVYLDGSTFILTRETKYTDIRTVSGRLENIIDKEDNYRSLLFLSLLYSSINEPSLSNKAFEKAKNINPGSCMIANMGQNYYANTNSNYFAELAVQSKNNHWYCF